jgi:putative ATP-binding cassette transporter
MVGHEHLNKKLEDEESAWDRTLSGGEQQRLAFARLFLHKPDIVVMDEATSALDPDSQTMLMNALGEKLPKTAIISVGHRPELEAFHERKVNLVRKEGGAKLVTGEVAAPPINVVSALMKRWRAPPAASPATPTATSDEPVRPPKSAA